MCILLKFLRMPQHVLRHLNSQPCFGSEMPSECLCKWGTKIYIFIIKQQCVGFWNGNFQLFKDRQFSKASLTKALIQESPLKHLLKQFPELEPSCIYKYRDSSMDLPWNQECACSYMCIVCLAGLRPKQSSIKIV